jgi:hypothetical protein
MVLEYYQTMYEKIPHQIVDAARNATETIRVTAEAQAKAAREETKKGLMKAVAEAVQATAKQFVRAEHFKWVSAAVSIVAITVLAVGWGENRRGQAQGFAAGESSAKAECAYATKLSTWALTPDGVRAYELEQLGSLHDLVTCGGRGLDRKGDWCVAHPSAAGRTAGESPRPEPPSSLSATRRDPSPRRERAHSDVLTPPRR